MLRIDIIVAKFDIELINESDHEVNSDRLVETATFAMNELRLHPETELSIACVDLGEMERLHIEHMDEPGATDVLSFPMDDLVAPELGETAEPGLMGDIVLCPEFAKNQAAEAGNEYEAELDMLLVHGVLHLLGHDHQEPDEHAVMFGLQNKLLDSLANHRKETK
ncbi:MAG: Endoribonuclease YbeY [Actinomycetota bacterium]